MPCITVTRDPAKLIDPQATRLGYALEAAVVSALKVKPHEVEFRVRDFGPLDRNHPPIAIEIDTGKGKDGWRATNRMELAKQIAASVVKADIIPASLLDPKEGPYAWLKIVDSAFVPLGFPDEAR
ncbi:hypothetical protein K8R03_02145 [Candidatus Kaiserbacteria bacterium]|nr:hypothetical protein [Candidatus Kaiserbacteria bacterium]